MLNVLFVSLCKLQQSFRRDQAVINVYIVYTITMRCVLEIETRLTGKHPT